MRPHKLSSAPNIDRLGPDDNAEPIMGDNIKINIKSTLPLIIIHTLNTVALPSSASSQSFISCTWLLILASLTLLSKVSMSSSGSEPSSFTDSNHGPRFLIEPPSRVNFLNETGTVISCKVSGIPPLRVWWTLSDGTSVSDVQGLRTVRSNGDLVLSAFSASMLRPDIHSTIYRCMASNSVGTIRSRDCQIRAVIKQPYNVQVYGEYAIAGNTGHLKCQIPAFVREYVYVTAWLKGDTILATDRTSKDSRFVILANGDLLIRNTTRADSGYYRCQTRHKLSQETVVSRIEGHFIVNDVISGVTPRIFSHSPVRARLGESCQLICVTKAWPQASVRWFQTSESGLMTEIHSSENVQIFDSLLYISRVTEQHSGNWICIANNSLGEERAYIELYTSVETKVEMVPEYLVADINSQANFQCNVTPVAAALSILWIKDGQPIILAGTSSSTSLTKLNMAYEGRIRLIEPHMLQIRSVVQEDAGCYQCVVQTESQTMQATATLKLGDSPPIFVETFGQGLVYSEGSQISLKCSATSTLLPQIRWFLDDQPIDGYAPRRLSMADYVKSIGHVVSFVNITNTKVIDGGEYKCTASNSAGSVAYSARINVMGAASLRPNWQAHKKKSSVTEEMSSIMVISGQTVTLICPVIAYPIELLVWQHRASTLPSNHRHKIEPIIGGTGGRLTIENVHRDNDQGQYDCTVKGSHGKAVRGSVQMVVRVAPLIDSQLISQTTSANQGMKVKLMCSVLEGDPPITIKWFQNDDFKTAIATNHARGISVQEDEDYSLLTFRSVSIDDMGNWTCRAWNDVLSVNKSTFLIVNVAPSWRNEPKSTQVVLGHSAVINCNADGYPNPRLLWKKLITSSNGAEYFQADRIDSTDQHIQHASEYRELSSTYRRQVYPNGTLWIQEVDKSDAGYYMCQVSNGIEAGLSKVIQLVIQSPPFFATKFFSKSVSKGETALLECEVEGDPVLHIRWYKDNALIMVHAVPNHPSNADNHESNHSLGHGVYDKRYSIKQDLLSSQKVISFLQITSVERVDSTIYTCSAKNSFGNDNTSVQLIVQETPDAPQNIEVLDVSSRSVQLQWKAPYSGNSPLIRFYVNYRQLNCTYLSLSNSGNSFWNELATETGGELRMVIKSLLPNCYYEIKLSSENQIGRSEQTTMPLTIQTLEEVPGGPPTDVQVETTSSTSLKIKWRPPIRSVHFGKIRGYYIGYKVASSDEPFQYKNVDAVNEDSNTLDKSVESAYQVSYITNLKRKTSYIIILQAYNSVGPGPRSDEIKISTFDSQPPTSPLLEVISTTYDAIVLKWDLNFQQQIDSTDLEEKEYVLSFREADLKMPIGEWHQKRIYSKNNQFVLSKENSQGKIRCGTKYHIYITATNSLGTGEPSETVMARTKGDTPIAPSKAEFIRVNATTAILTLKSWQTRGCPIEAFTIQYKPIHQKQWIPLVEYFEKRDYFYVSHLNANRDYQLLISAHSEPGVTRQEYTFHTSNSSNSVVQFHGTSASASPMDPYRIDSVANSNVHLRNLTVLLPVLISLMMLIVILGTLFGCLRRQQVNQVVNSVDAHSTTRHHADLCIEHLTNYNGKEGSLLMSGTGAVTQECYPLTEFQAGATLPSAVADNLANNCPAMLNDSSCNSKSNITMANGNNFNLNKAQLFGTSPRHRILMSQQCRLDNGQANLFATLNCSKMKLISSSKKVQQQSESYYSSPQRKLINSMPTCQNNMIHRLDHEYAEPLQTMANIDVLLVEGSNKEPNCGMVIADCNTTNSYSTNAADAAGDAESVSHQQHCVPIKVELEGSNDLQSLYSTISKQTNNICMPYL